MTEFSPAEARRAVFASQLTPSEKLVLLAILDHWSRRYPRPRPGAARLATMTGLNERTVRRVVAALVRESVIPDPTRKGQNWEFDVSVLPRTLCPGSDALDPGHDALGPMPETPDIASTNPGHLIPGPRTSDPGTPDIGITKTAKLMPVHRGRMHEECMEESMEESINGADAPALFALGSEEKDRQDASPEQTVFDCWAKTMDHPKARLDPKRRSRIRARLKRWSTSELCRAICGAKLDPWLMGEDPRAPRRYDGLETILRDDAQVERLIELAERPPIRRQSVPAVSSAADAFSRKVAARRSQQQDSADLDELVGKMPEGYA